MKRRFLLAIPIAITVAAALFLSSNRAQSTPALLSEAQLFDRAVTEIERNYIDPTRINPRKMLDGAISELERTVPEILVRDDDAPTITLEVGLAQKRIAVGPMSSSGDLKRAVGEILAFIGANYHGDTKPEEIEYAAIDGMLEALDPHSNFMPPKVFNEFQVGTRGKFGGLGIVISIKDGQLAVIAPIEDTPAARAGVRAGDRILQIDDESTINMSLTDAVNKLRGDVGTKVTIITERPGKAPRKLLMTRALINIDSVKHKLLAENGRRIGYIKVKNFQQNTDADVRAALASFHADGAALDGVILDLRNNPGGLLSSAISIADRFLPSGVIVTTVGARDQVLERESARPAGTKESAPIVVLINEGSASASEIVAGALQANDRALVMGRRSFGKGSVQSLFDLGSDSALKLTIAQYKPAGTLAIQLAGLTPDVDLQPVTVDRQAMNLVEDVLPSEGDLEQHLESSAKRDASPHQRSPFSVRYLQPKEDEKDSEERSLREYAKEPEIEKDFTVTLARRFLAANRSNSRQAMLAETQAVLRAADAEQTQAMSDALRLVGIDWSSHKAQEDPKLKVAYRLLSGKSEVARARAGHKVELEFTATNTGTGPYSRLIAIGQSDMPFLANREFPFGFLPPGASRSFRVPLELPEGLPRQDLLMDVTFEEENGRRPEPMTAVVPVEELPAPSFSFGFQMLGHSFAGAAPVTLPLNVENVGTGTSSADTVATLSNDCGEKLFIESGRTKLGAIAPKASRRTAFRFHLAPDFSEATCSLKLLIADPKRFVSLQRKIDLKVKTATCTPPPGGPYAPPRIDAAKLPTSTAETSVSLEGTITDDDPIRDYFIFVGDKKIAYVPNPQKTQELSFRTVIPLEPGSNTIVIGARDEQDLLSRKILVVNRTSGERKKDRRYRDIASAPDMGGGGRE